MKVAVINLAADAPRWLEVRRQFRRVGLEPQRQEAVPGSELTMRQLAGLYCEQLNRRRYHKALRSGEIGCYASHMLAWQRLLQSREPYAAVFEDDVEIAPDLPLVLDALERSPPAWDIVKLVGRTVEWPAKARPLVDGRNLISYRRVPSLTSAYVISRRGAAKLLATRLPFGRPIDVDMRHWWECGLRLAGVYPYPVSRGPRSDESTISNRDVPVDFSMRLHKLWLQVRYSVLNQHARAVAGRRDRSSRLDDRVWAVGESLAHHDAA